MIELIERYLEKVFISDKHRLEHIQNVKKVALELADIHQVDKNKVVIAALLHDATKTLSFKENSAMVKDCFEKEEIRSVPRSCLHAYSAYVLAKTEFGIEDIDILNAIKHHCAGRPNMSQLEKIIFVSDFIEEGRSFVDERVNELAKTDLTKATYEIMLLTREYLIKNNRNVAKSTETAIEEYGKELEEIND